MKAEIEVRFANVDREDLRQRLKAAGAVCREPMHGMRRTIVDYADRRLQIGQKDAWGFVRVRDDGKRVQVTYKHVSKNNKDTSEIEFDVSSYEKAVELFEAIGLKPQGEQHTRREVWELNGCEVTIDEWPWIEPMSEIEGPTANAVTGVAEKLGFDLSQAIQGNAQDIYMLKYPGIGEHEAISEIPSLNFDIFPDWLRDRRQK